MNAKSPNARSRQIARSGALTLMALLALACAEERPVPSCDEVADVVYDEGWELWCSSEGSTVYIDTCNWYDDNDPANFSEPQAQSICEEIADLAEDERCEPEFDDSMVCLAENAGDPQDCEDQWSDLLDCVF